MEDDFQGNEIAIVGIACRFPDADSPRAFWENLIAKRESIVHLSPQQLRQKGVPEAVLDSGDYVPAGAALENFDTFDADLFQMSAKEAVTTDPQHRLFLECAWEALEASGELQRRDGLSVGVYGGAGPNTYLLQHFTNENAGETNLYLDTASGFLTMLGNDKDYVCTRTSFKLDLRGPSLNVQSACSTGLLAVHLACQALQLGECDVALAGASSVLVPHGVGYLYQPGGIVSGDGRCRAFDASADGTVFASGVGVVALKRLDDAMADRDFIYAVIRGSAANNDGADKASFGAPSVRGQADVIRQALMNAGISPASVSYIETHGTGTPLGDPIEARALSDVFAGLHAEPGSCALGAVKTNIGHLSAAAGIAGLIKAALSLQHKTIAPTLHFETLNPEISFDETPFFINTEPLDWASEGPRRAGVTSLGVGGTNVHVVMQEAPPRNASDESAIAPRTEVLTLSAHSVPALRDLATNYRDFLRSSEHVKLQDIAYSANTGLAVLPYRTAVVAADNKNMAAQLDNLSKTVGNISESDSGKVAFLFSGHGAHYAGMGRTLYENEPVFRRWIESSAPLVEQVCGANLIDILFPANPTDTLIDQPRYAQPALLAFEYALAQLWLSRGLQPDVLIGHSLGEYTAACLAGLFEFPDALRLVAARSRLMQETQPAGWMLAVALSVEDATRLIADRGGDLWIAAINAPNSVVVSGTATDIMSLRQHLTIRDISNSVVNTSFASHCPLMESVLSEFAAVAETVAFSPAKVPIITNVSGTASPDEMASAQYWCDHLRKPVLFAQSVDAALQMGARIFLEIGPRPVLANLGKLCSSDRPDASAITWVAAVSDSEDDEKQDAIALAELYQGGAKISWRHLYNSRKLSRVELPTYPFQRRRFWPTPEAPDEPWFHQTIWTEDKGNVPRSGKAPDILLICGPRQCAANHLVNCLEQKIMQDKGISEGHRPVVIYVEDMKLDEIQRLVRDTPGEERPRQCLITYVAFREKIDEAAPSSDRQTVWENIYEAGQFLRNLSKWEGQLDFHLQVITRNAMSVTDSDTKVDPSQAAICALGAVFANEHPGISCSLIDLDNFECRDAISFLLKQEKHGQYAFRGDHRFEARLQDFEIAETPVTAIRNDGTYLITGGLGGIGKSIARWLVALGAGKIVLVGRTIGDAAKQRDLALLRHLSPDIRFESADMASNGDIARVVEAIDASGFPLRGILHAAGVNESGMFPDLSSDSLERALKPKVQGAMLLDRHTRGHDLDFFVCFSSLSSMLGFRGQAAYVAANAAMEGIVTRRAQEGLPALAMCWGPWEGEGMSSNLTDAHRARLSTMGIRSFPPEVGLAKLHSLLGHRGVCGAFPIDWTSYFAQFGEEVPPLLSDLGVKPNDRQQPKTAGKFKDDVATVPVETRQQFIVDAVSSIVAKSIGSPPETISADVPINRLGFDSLTTLELRNALKALGVNLPLGPLFAGASINDIAQIVCDQVRADTPSKTNVAAVPVAGEPLVVKNKGVDPRLKLVCFAYAGGGPAVFNEWAEAFGSDSEVAVVQLPGRGSRLNETPYTTMNQLVDDLSPALAEYIDRPFAFFGHCIGGVQAFELTHHLHQTHGILPVHLFVAGSRAPQIYNDDQATGDAAQFGATAARAGVATDQDFIEMLQDVNFANNKALFKDSELLSLMLPVIKADYQLNNTYRYQPKPPLDLPITALGGRADPYTTGQHILAWEAHSKTRLTTQFLPGDHYFMETQSDLLIDVASRTLAEHLTRLRRSDFRLISFQ